MQNEDDVQETELSPVPGAGWNAQLDPSQCSMSVDGPVSFSNDPTAVQSVAEVHDTPASAARSGRSAAVEVLSRRSREPLERAAKVRLEPEESMVDPTTMQAADEVHDTPLSDGEPAALTGFHLDPFQR